MVYPPDPAADDDRPPAPPVAEVDVGVVLIVEKMLCFATISFRRLSTVAASQYSVHSVICRMALLGVVVPADAVEDADMGDDEEDMGIKRAPTPAIATDRAKDISSRTSMIKGIA